MKHVSDQFESESSDSETSNNSAPTQPNERWITTMQTSSAATCLGIIDEYPFTRECIATSLQALGSNFKVLTFAKVDDCLIASSGDFDLAILHIHADNAGQPSHTIGSLKSVFRSLPVIILSDLDANEWVLEALQSGARGYIPTGSTSVAIAVEAIRLVRAGGTFVPPSSLQMMQHSPPGPELTLEDPLTPRQLAVLQYLTQGKSNKIIAYELGMSESTVKVHVRTIMKKVHATNRTEAAFRARNLCSDPQKLRDLTARPNGRNGGASS